MPSPARNERSAASPRAQIDLARAYVEQGLFQDANDALERALELDPTNVEARAEILVVRRRLGTGQPFASA